MVHRLRRSAVFGDGLAIASEPVLVDAGHPPHSHDFLELVVVTEGRGVHTSVSGRQPLRRGSLAVVRPGDWHDYDDCRSLTVWNVYVGADVFSEEVGLVWGDVVLTRSLWSLDRSGRNAGATLPALDENALGRVEGWLRELGDDTGPAHRSPLIQAGLLLCVLGQCVPQTPGQDLTGDRRTHPAVLSAIRLLENDIAAPWTVERLSREVHVSSSYLARSFTSAVGAPPIAYVNRLRAERVAAMLLESDRSVSSIGASVGWPDPNYASRRFRAAFGLSPAVYRRRLRPEISADVDGYGPA